MRTHQSLARSGRVIVAVALALALAVPAFAGKADEVRVEAFKKLNEGVAAYKRGEFVLAIDSLGQSAGMALNNFRAHYFLGLALIGDRRYAAAVEPLQVALDLDPNHLLAHVALGDAYLKQGDTGEAMAEYFRALKIRAEFAPALDGMARVYESQAEDEKALSFFERAIRSNKGFADAYTHLGDFHLRRGEIDKAVARLAEAVEIRPDFGPGLNRLALAYSRLGLSNEAVATVRKAIELEPGNPSHLATLGEIRLGLGKLATAEQALREALTLDPGLPDARRGLAELARRRGEYDDALEQIDIALEDERIEYRDARTLKEFRGRIVAEQTRVAELEQAEQAGEADAAVYRELARIYAGREMWERAAAMQRRAGESREERSVLAYMLFRSGRYRDAHEAYASLLQERPDAAMSVNDGVSLSLLGRHEQALAAYDRALALEADHREALLYRGNALVRLGRRDEAIETYRRFLALGGNGEAEERVRRILTQFGALPAETASPAPAANDAAGAGS